MTIPYFAAHQTQVFVPALAAAAGVALLVVLPVVFAPTLRRARRGRGIAWTCGVLAALALVLAGQQTADGLGTLAQQRAAVIAQLRTRYGVAVDQADAAVLVNGGAVTLPRFGPHPLRLHLVSGDRYEPYLLGKPLPAQA